MNHKKKGMVRQMKRQSMRNKMMAWIMVFAMVVSSINVMTFKQRVNAEETEVTGEMGENPDNMVKVTLDAGEGYFGTVESQEKEKNNIPVNTTKSFDEFCESLEEYQPSLDGCTLGGWYMKKDENENVLITKDNFDSVRADIEANTKLYAYYKVKVTLDADGGELPEGAEQEIEVTVGGTYGRLPEPTKKGNKFDGWYLGETKIDKESKVDKTGERTLKAKWVINEFQAAIESNSMTYTGEAVTPEVTVTAKDEKLTAGTDYEIIYFKKDDNPTATDDKLIEMKNAGIYTITIKGINKYAAYSAQLSFEITQADGKVQIQCGNIKYGESFKPELTENTNPEGNPVWYYKEKDAADTDYKKLNEKELLNAGTYCIKAEVGETQNYKAATSNVVSVTVNKAVPKYNLPQSKNIRAHCGEKLSDVSLAVQNDNGHFEWKNPDKILKEGSNKEYIKFIPNDTKNYTESKDILVQFEVIHDFTAKNCFEYEAETEPVVPKTNKKGKEVEAGIVGHRESYKCKGCGKQFDAKTKQEHDASWFVKPCCVKELTVELGKTYSLKDFVKVGQEYVDTKSTAFKNQKYLKWDKNKETLKAVKYYKDELKKQTITFKDKAGYDYDVKLKVTIAAPKVVKANKKFTKKTQGIQIKRKSIKISGRNYYKYTIKYNVKDAKSLKITASGFKGKNTQKTLNKLLAKRIKKAKGTYSFGVVKTAVKKKKITFKIVADYGHKNKSESVLIKE